MTAPQPARTGEFTGRHMWLVLIAFFGTIIAVNVTMAVLSSTSWTGLVVQNSYVASQEFEAKRQAHEAQLAAGWAADLQFVDGMAVLRVVDGNKRFAELGEVTLQVNRPVGGHDDQRVALVRMADGTHAAPIVLGQGMWEVLVSAPDSELGRFVLHQRLRLPELGL